VPTIRVRRPLRGRRTRFLRHGTYPPLRRGDSRRPHAKWTLKPIGIRGIITRQAARAGLADRIRGTHVIRHSVATLLINEGASIKQIADLLGHRSIDTTAIYAKVDLRSFGICQRV
jgi:integrase